MNTTVMHDPAPNKPPKPTPSPPAPPVPDGVPPPIHDPTRPEHPDPVRDPPADRPPVSAHAGRAGAGRGARPQ